MKLLVTGGAGFIGANFIQYWLAAHPEDQIVNLDLLTYAGNKENLAPVADNPSYKFIQGDILDADLIDKLVAEADTVVHFAAETHVDRSILGPAAFIETNVKGTFVLLEAVRKHNKRLHHISTDEVFGALELGSSSKFDEETPYNPHSPYSASKAASDHLVRAYYDTYGVVATITNCSNNFGPYQYPEKFIPRMITNLIDGENVKIYGDGKYVRDWLYVTDHCRAIDKVIHHGQPGTTYVVGGIRDNEVSNLDVAKLILKQMGESEDKIEFVKDRPGHDRRYAVNWQKIHTELDWEPEHTFEEWLNKTIDWYKNNEAWWRPLKEGAEALYKKTGQ